MNTNVLLIIGGVLFGIGILIWIILISRNSSQKIQRPPKPIFPQPIKKDQAILFDALDQSSKLSDGLIDAGVQMEYLVLKNKERLFLYSSTDPADNLWEFLNAGKSAYITAWVSTPDNQDKELARIRIKIKKETKKAGFTGHRVEICLMTILDFNISTTGDFYILELYSLLLERLEVWGRQFGATDIIGEVSADIKNEFKNRKYRTTQLSSKVIRVIKHIAP